LIPIRKCWPVVDGLVQEPGDVIVIEGVDGGLALPGTGDQAKVAEHAQLMGDRGVLHADVGRELGDRAGLAAQPGQDQQPARGSQRLQVCATEAAEAASSSAGGA
jgi:hypothetical protein